MLKISAPDTLYFDQFFLINSVDKQLNYPLGPLIDSAPQFLYLASRY